MKEQPGTVLWTKPGRWMEEGGGWGGASGSSLPRQELEPLETPNRVTRLAGVARVSVTTETQTKPRARPPAA